MIDAFNYEAVPGRVLFGAGRLSELGAAIESLGCRRALVLSTPGHAAAAGDLASRLGVLAVGTYSRAAMHTPVTVTEDALAAVERLGADCVVALGGGSTIGLGKALALRTDLPQVAIPTTYAGSEMTDILGETKGGEKTTQRTPKVRPEVVIYDVDLTLSLPPGLSATSGMNAIAHSVEALYARDGNPVVALMAEDSIRALAASLPRLVIDPADRDARSDAQYGAWLASACLASVSIAIHHKLAHVIGGAFNLAHADTHTILLPHSIAYNAEAAPAAMGRIARALGSADAAGGIFALGRRLGVPSALKDIGMPEAGIDRATELALKNPYWNPRPLEAESIRRLIRNAYEGLPPAA